jgi:hypothetical protein
VIRVVRAQIITGRIAHSVSEGIPPAEVVHNKFNAAVEDSALLALL